MLRIKFIMSFYFDAVFGCSMGGILWGTISYRLLVNLDLRNEFQARFNNKLSIFEKICVEIFLIDFYHYAYRSV